MYDYIVVGGGLAGIISVIVLKQKYPNGNIAWIDNHGFSGGDLSIYPKVPANTPIKKVERFINILYGMIDISDNEPFVCNSLKEEIFELGCFAKELVKITKKIKENYNCFTDNVLQINKHTTHWTLRGEKFSYPAHKIILAIGSSHNILDNSKNRIELIDALHPDILKTYDVENKRIIVYGNSHSGMLILKNLYELGCKHITNVYKHKVRIPYMKNGVEVYDQTGLRGVGVKWSQEVLPNSNIKQVQCDKFILNEYDYVIYAVGLSPRRILIVGDDLDIIDSASYDRITGKICEGVYGIGVAYPDYYELEGVTEYKVGMFEFLERAFEIL